MIPVQFDYVAPDSVAEAVKLLKANRNGTVLAGGLSLLTDMKLRRAAPAMLIDLCKISDLRGISRHGTNGNLQIGAMTTYAEIAAAKEVRESYFAIAEAVKGIGDQQVRNCGTIGGNLAYSDPAADLPAVALALEATINSASTGGIQAISADEFFTGAYKTMLTAGEIITSVSFPTYLTEAGSAYEKFKNPASSYAICGVAAIVKKAAKGTIDKCRVAVTGAADHVVRLREVEVVLEGKEPTVDNIVAAAKRVTDEGLIFLSDFHASADYRAHLTEVLTERALTRAVERA